MRVSWLIRNLGHGTYATLSKKRFDTECRRFHLLMVTVNRENWKSSGGSRASEQFCQWFSHSLTMRLAYQLSPFTHLSPRFHFRFEWMQKALEKTAHSLHFPHCSFSFLCWNWPSADETVDIMCLLTLMTITEMFRDILLLMNLTFQAKLTGCKFYANLIRYTYNNLAICLNMSQFIELIMFVLMGTGMTILVLFNFITLRLYNIFPFFMWCVFPTVSLAVIGVIQATVPVYLEIGRQAEQFVKNMKWASVGHTFYSKYIGKRTRAMFPLRFNVGLPGFTFFSFMQSTRVTYYEVIMVHTLNLIIAVP